jgi:hypothetical protein
MKKTILALAAAGLLPLVAGAQSPEPSAPPQPQERSAPSPSPGSPPAVAPTPPPAAATTPAPTRFEPKTTYGDVARVLSSQPVYERAPSGRECRMEGTGYSSAASELPRCDEQGQSRERVVAYDVTYQYMGREFRIRMPFDPGEQMAVNVDVRPPGADRRSGYRIPRSRGPY